MKKKIFDDSFVLVLPLDVRQKFTDRCAANFLDYSVVIRGWMGFFIKQAPFYREPVSLTIYTSNATHGIQVRISRKMKAKFFKACKRINSNASMVIKGFIERFLIDQAFFEETVNLFKDESGDFDDLMLIGIEPALKRNFFEVCGDRVTPSKLIRAWIDWYLSDDVQLPDIEEGIYSGPKNEILIFNISREKKELFCNKCRRKAQTPPMVIRLLIRGYIYNKLPGKYQI